MSVHCTPTKEVRLIKHLMIILAIQKGQTSIWEGICDILMLKKQVPLGTDEIGV